ncbi:MAG: beta-lactamase domain-containing protein [Bacillota bacterium]|nr:MAG: beta-lactamase domain-containing protein [Bacillota bacterium]
MSYEIGKLTDELYAIAVWDDELNTLNNCYVLKSSEHGILIDSGKAAHSHTLVKALTQLDILPVNISLVVTTHGHNDHVGGAATFTQATRLIPEQDMYYLPDSLKPLFSPLPQSISDSGLEIIPLGHHTKGHTAYYYPRAKALFCGDYLTFYGEKTPNLGLVTTGEHLIEKSIDNVHRWLESPAVQARYDTIRFRHGLHRLASLDAEFLCTGHGPVLKGALVQELLQKLAQL